MPRILKTEEFILENILNTPSSYARQALNVLKNKITSVFEEMESEGQEGNLLKRKNPYLGLNLESAELSANGALYDTLTIKYSDEEYTYSLIVSIDLKEAVPNAPTTPDEIINFSYKDIEFCYVKFKKYDLDNFELLGEYDENIKLNKFLKSPLEEMSKLKMKVDDIGGEEDEDFKIEY